MVERQPIPTSVAALVGRSVVDASGQALGRVTEFAVDTARDGSRVAALVLKSSKGGKSRALLPVEQIEMPKEADGVLRALQQPDRACDLKDFLLLERDLLDQQIIDVDGRKVVRVSDVDLLWEPGENGNGAAKGLLVQQVEVGLRGASRRLLKGLPVVAVDGVAGQFKERVIPWDFVDLIDRDPARRVRLKIGQDRLEKLHPSDIAEILEDLAPAEREAVFASLPEETAAEALEEIDPKVQKELLQGMDSERAADIIEEMDPGAAADLLNELSDAESEAILEEMEPEERQDVEELLEFAPNSAAGLMTTDFLSEGGQATVADAVEALRQFEGDPDTITEIYLLDEEKKLSGVVTLPRLLLAKPEITLANLAETHQVSCGLNARDREVAELFDKYNLRSLPVLNSEGGVAGVIHAEQVIAKLRES
jgi:magnesium transporter